MRRDTINSDAIWAALGRLWVMRGEVLRLAAMTVALALTVYVISGWLLVIALILLAAAVLANGDVRRWAHWQVMVWHTNRWWKAVTPATILARSSRVPKVKEVVNTPAGTRIRVRLVVGQSVEDLEKAAPVLAAAANCREVRVTRDPVKAKFAQVTFVTRDPLDTPAIPWAHAHAERLSLWDPIPVGVDENGQVATIRLPEKNILLGGEPGGGKSAAISMLAATAALDPEVRLWLMDGKLVELAAWEPCAHRTAGAAVDDAVELLRDLREEMEERYRHLLADGLRKTTAADGFPLHMVICDELAFYLTCEDRKQRAVFGDLLRDIVARGRAAGIIVVAATQKPGTEVIPSSLRDLFALRWAMRCNTPQASDTIMGQGWASEGYSAARIAPDQRGVGFLLAEDGLPRRIRAGYLDDAAVDALATRARALRTPVMPAQTDEPAPVEADEE